MDPLTLGLIFGGAGLAKSLTIDKARENAQRHNKSEHERYSWLTGDHGGTVEEANPFGATLSGAFTGAQLGNNMQMAQAQKGLAQAQTGWLNRGGDAAKAAAAGASFNPAAVPASPAQFSSGFTPVASYGGGYGNYGPRASWV